MTVTVSWYDPDHTIVHYCIQNGWNWETFYPALEKALQMEFSVSHRVDVIVQLPDSVNMPPSVITHIGSIARQNPPNLHKTVFVSSNQLAKMFISLAKNISPIAAQNYTFVDNIEEALTFIQTDRISA
jgi:hypothetical protein